MGKGLRMSSHRREWLLSGGGVSAFSPAKSECLDSGLGFSTLQLCDLGQVTTLPCLPCSVTVITMTAS